MKKYILIALAVGLAGTMLAGCGSDPVSSTTSVDSETSSTISEIVSSEVSSGSEVESIVSEITSSEVSSASSAVSSSTSSAASSKPASSTPSSSKPASSTPSSSKPASSTTSSKPTSSTTSSKPAASKPAASATPQQICKAIASAYGSDYYPDGEMPKEYIYGQFSVDTSLVESVYGEMSMISIHPDQVIVMKAASGKGAQLETAMKKERDKYVETAMLYPKDHAKLNASKVVRNGDYVAFLMLGAIDETNDNVESAEAQKFAQDQIAIGVKAFQNAAK